MTIETPGQHPRPSKLATIPFVLNLNQINLPVSVNNSEPLWLILDTGAQATVIDPEAARRAGLKYRNINGQAGGAGGATLQLAVARNVSLRLAGLRTSCEQVFVVPVSQVLSSFVGRATQGVLGYDFISRYVIEIDYAEKRLHLYDPQTYQYSGAGKVMPLTILNNHPHVRATLTLPGKKSAEADLIIDTGASPPLLLATSFVEAHGLMASGPDTVPMLTGGAGGLSPAAARRIVELRCGSISLKNLVAYLAQSKQDALANLPGADGVLGAEVLRRYTVIWDYSRHRLILEPNKYDNDPYEDAVTGMLLKTEGPDFKIIKVAGVADHSPAAAAGLRAEDRILEIDGKSAERFTLDAVTKMFARPQTYQLLIERGAERLEVTLKPRKPE